MKVLVIFAVIAALVGCGKDEKKEFYNNGGCPSYTYPEYESEDPLNNAVKECHPVPENAVEGAEGTEEVLHFEGYVQTAFEITVDGVEFRDTEHFYSRFREDLIIPNHPELAEAEIEVLGEYGHNKFGTDSSVYMAPMGNEGHQFYGTTDNVRHFNIDVNKAGDNAEYRAKIMLRIGLVIDGITSCYLLHSTMEGIKFVSDKPIIFDTFNTQLNKWQCSPNETTPIEIEKPPVVEEVVPNEVEEVVEEVVKVQYNWTQTQVLEVLGEPTSRETAFINGTTSPAWIYAGPDYCEASTGNCIIYFSILPTIVVNIVGFHPELVGNKPE